MISPSLANKTAWQRVDCWANSLYPDVIDDAYHEEDDLAGTYMCTKVAKFGC